MDGRFHGPKIQAESTFIFRAEEGKESGKREKQERIPKEVESGSVNSCFPAFQILFSFASGY
jgi:hypothetical protein